MSSWLEDRGAISDDKAPLLPQSVEARCVACLFKLPHDIARIPGDTPFDEAFKPNDEHPNGYSPTHIVVSESFQKSIQRGCTVCKAIYRSRGFSSTPYELGGYISWEKNYIKTYKDGSWNSWSRQIFFVYEGDSRIQYPHPFIGTRRSVGDNTGSTQTMARIQGWINACVANHSHPGCGNELEMLLPKGVRMLEIEDHRQAKVRLIENLPKAKFAALSHRWGPKTETASLKQANLNEFQKQVPRSSLYELLRDAIQVAGEIGLRYIWIDCLCIIQDNLKDWNYQSGQMASIYAGAFITISGTGFIDDDKGLFRDSPIAANIIIAENVPCPLYLGPRLQHPYIGTYGPGPHRMELTPEDYPLAGRGWVYQERVLSKRILHFTSQEVIWECLGKPQCECGWLDYRDLCHQSDILDLPWIEIVTQYSRMHLTEKTDRLPAIAGIAKSYADLHSRTYLAGLWEETLAGDLLWLAGDQLRLSQMPGPTYTPESLGPRDRPLVAPTWSWASAKPLRSLSRWPPPSLSTHVILEKYDFEHEPGGDSYSQPVRAHLHVEGPVIFGTLKDGYFEHGVYFRMQFKDKTAVFMPDYDITAAGDDHIEFGATLPFLLLMGDGEGGAFGIVLHGKKEDGIMNYERIGIIAIQGEEPLQCSWVLERSTRMKLILV